MRLQGVYALKEPKLIDNEPATNEQMAGCKLVNRDLKNPFLLVSELRALASFRNIPAFLVEKLQ